MENEETVQTSENTVTDATGVNTPPAGTGLPPAGTNVPPAGPGPGMPPGNYNRGPGGYGPYAPGGYRPQPNMPNRPGYMPGAPCPPGPPGGMPYYRPEPPRSEGPGFFSRLFFSFFFFVLSCCFILFIGFVGMMCLAAVFSGAGNIEPQLPEKTVSGNKLCTGKVAVIPIDGIIRGDEDGFVRRAIRQAQKDDDLDAVVLRINSPGGTMAGSDYYHYLLKELKKEKDIPIIVSMGSLAASGGYYIATVGDKIYAEPSTLTGSIGVIIPLYNASGLCEKIGFSSNSITSGAMKGMGDFTKPMNPEERVIWQSLVDSSYEQFLRVIKEGRPAFQTKKKSEDNTDSKENAGSDQKKDGPFDGPKADASKTDVSKSDDKSKKAEKTDSKSDTQSDKTDKAADKTAKSDKSLPAKNPDAELRKIADGRIYTADQALKLGLIDEIGFLDKAILHACDAAGLDADNVHVIKYRSPGGLSALLGETESTVRGNNVSEILSDTLHPEVYYLCPGTFPVGKEKK